MNIPFIKRVNIKNVEVETPETYKEERIGNITFPDKLTNENAFVLANTVAEIYFPIDFIADRVSKLRYFVTKNGKEVKGTELIRFVQDINPLFTFSDLIYQAIFSYLSDGNIISYRAVPSLYASVSADTISRVDVIQPTSISIEEYNNVMPIYSNSWNELIKKVKYIHQTGRTKELLPENIIISQIDNTRRDDSMIFANSPLYKSLRNINNLLAVYSARYNVYVNNGYAGLLVRKAQGANDKALGSVVTPSDRKRILEDLNTNGITGNRNRWGINGITGVPVEFINTLSTIKDLLPFEEVLEDSVKIAGNYQIPSGLVPRKDQSTFDNQNTQERQVWENAIMSIADSFGAYWAKVCKIDSLGYSFAPDYSTVSCLQANEIEKEDLIQKKLSNLKMIKDLNPEADISNELNNILSDYGKG